MGTLRKLIKKRSVQLLLAALVGAALSAALASKSTSYRYEKTLEEQRSRYERQLKTLNEQLASSEAELERYISESSRQLAMLKQENRRLRTSMKKNRLKIVKPDGTIIEKEYEEAKSDEVTSVVTSIKEEYVRKVRSIESKWKKVHLKRIAEIKKEYEERLKKRTKVVERKTVKINEKKIRSEVGLSSERTVYTHTTYNFAPPFFIGGGSSFRLDDRNFHEIRIGVGMEF